MSSVLRVIIPFLEQLPHRLFIERITSPVGLNILFSWVLVPVLIFQERLSKASVL